MNKYIFTLLAFIFFIPNSAFAHSGGLDRYCGHKCSATSQQKGLCRGYHYHYKNCPKDSAMDKTNVLKTNAEGKTDSELHQHLHTKTESHTHS